MRMNGELALHVHAAKLKRKSERCTWYTCQWYTCVLVHLTQSQPKTGAVAQLFGEILGSRGKQGIQAHGL